MFKIIKAKVSVTKGCLLFATCMLSLLFGCQPKHIGAASSELQRWLADDQKVKVLCTTQMVSDLVKQIGRDEVGVMTLIVGQLDPHTYELIKGDDEKLAAADIIFYNGLGLEHGPSLHHHLSSSVRAVSLGDFVMNKDPDLILYVGEQIDPHIWLDISLWAGIVEPIVKELSKVDPAHAMVYQIRGDELYRSMLLQHEKVRGILQAVPQHRRYLVTSHDAFNYFTRAYLAESNELIDHSWKKRCKAPEGLAPEGQLGVFDIQCIVGHLVNYQVHVIFPDSNVSKNSIKKIVDAAKNQGLTVSIATDVLYADAMGPIGSKGDNYLGMVEWDGITIAGNLMANP